MSYVSILFVFPYWFTAKGANISDTASFKFFYFFHPLFIVLNCCLSFALLYQTQILDRKKVFHLIHFQEIFHIMYLNFLGANNGEQDCLVKQTILQIQINKIPIKINLLISI